MLWQSAVEGVGMSGFWHGRKVFLTGHTGFKGSWLSLWFQHLGADVSGYALAPSTDPNMFEVARVETGMRSTIGDVRDGARLGEALRTAEPEFVFHLAAQPIVRDSYVDPVGTYATNVMGTANLLQAARSVPHVRAVLVVTSDKCYENRELDRGYVEEDPMGGFDPYSSSKGCTELLTASFRRSFFSNASQSGHVAAVATVRAGNVIGGGDWSRDRLIPDLMRAISTGQPVRIRNPTAIRPWQHVLEPLHGYLVLAQALFERGSECAEAWNFGPAAEDARPVQWIVERLVDRWGPPASWSLDSGTHPHESRVLMLSHAKATRRLGWTPRWRLDAALEKVADWHKAMASGTDMRSFTVAQIKEYEGCR